MKMKICPICESQDLAILTNKLRDTISNTVLVCKHCETGFLEDIKPQEELDEYYKENYRKDFKPNLQAQTNAKDLFDTYKNFQADRIKIISPFFNTKNRLLEIGCSAGMFLYLMKKHFKEIVGIELDRDSAYFASNTCDCSVYQIPLHLTTIKPEYFDVICAFQVLEHVASPIDFIQKAKRFLKKDGVLFFELPNRFDALVSTYDLPFHNQFFYHSAHNYYFSEKGLKVLLEKCGLEAEFIYTQDYNILNHVNWINNDQPQESCIPGLSSPKLNFKNDVSDSIKQNLSGFFIKVDKDYKKILCDLKISSNIAFIAKSKN
jgi:2-polyprenyl-3-methyl-5-hydroxy-6-metoxy-1,4-benzoquinol methylase